MVKYIRKLQKTSKETYIISLPIEWIRSKGLKKNDPIIIRNLDNFLLIKPKTPEKNKMKINYTEVPLPLLEQIIIGAYIKGIDNLIIQKIPYENVTKVTQFIKDYLFGSYGEYNPSTQELNIIFYVEEQYTDKNKILLHLFYLVEWFIKSSYNALNSKNPQKILSTMDIMDKEVDKYYYLSLRLYSSTPLSRYANVIENIADSFVNIAELKRLTKKDKEEIKNILKILDKKFNNITNYYTYKNVSQLSYTTEDLKKLNNSLRKTKYSYITEPIRLLRDLCEIMIDELLE